MKISITILGLFTSLLAVSQAFIQEKAQWRIGQRVPTSSGPVDGHTASNRTQVSEYLGIPFAKPPINDLRYEPPQKYTGNTVINGTNFGFTCPQILPTLESVLESYAMAPPGVLTPVWLTWNVDELNVPYILDEDCLTMNVWTKPQVGDAKKAVLVWIYGGGFTTGTTQVPYNNGQFLAEDGDLVVVSFNYRINVLGFPGSPGGPWNAGLLDQRLAIEWIYENIAGFGGDPDRITLIGQSAGGYAVDYYMYSYPHNSLIAGGIEESGTAFAGVIINQTNIAGTWYATAQAVGCGNSSLSVEAVMSCMKKARWQDLLAVPPTGIPTDSFWPTIDNKIIFENYTERSRLGEMAKVPLLIGNNDNESGLFGISFLILNITDPIFGPHFDLVHSSCPAGQRANASIQNGVPTWRYRYFGDFPDLRLTENPNSGAWHGEEITVIWDTIPETPGISKTEAEKNIQKYVQGAWVTFAKDPVNGLNHYEGGWPQWDPTKKTMVRLAFNNMTGTNLAFPSEYDAACAGHEETGPVSINL